jgi:putative nucleotidyltransferase with HDIG domain
MKTTNPLLLTVRALMAVIDAAEVTARGRSLRVTRYALAVAREMGVPESEWETLELGALLHDLGRTAVLNDVVAQPRPLSTVERDRMRTHATIGREMIKDIPGLESAAEIVWAHHEQMDGRGYPRGLRGDEIPIGARIVMVCAAFEAMTEDRPYRPGLSPTIACEELERQAGTQFFPDVVSVFLRLHHDRRLWDGFSAEELDQYVHGTRAETLLRPAVRGRAAKAA